MVYKYDSLAVISYLDYYMDYVNKLHLGFDIIEL